LAANGVGFLSDAAGCALPVEAAHPALILTVRLLAFLTVIALACLPASTRADFSTSFANRPATIFSKFAVSTALRVTKHACTDSRQRGAVTHGSAAQILRSKKQMKQGTVKWFSAPKGFGFIVGDDGLESFVHFSAIQAEGYKSLDEGQRVEYEQISSPKGPQATNVRVITEAVN